MKKIKLEVSDRTFLLRNCISYRILIYNEQDRYMHKDTNDIRNEMGIEEILIYYFNGLPRVCLILGKDNAITQIHLSDSIYPRGEKLTAFFSGLLEQARIYTSIQRNDPDLINIYTFQDIMSVFNNKLNWMLTDAGLINSKEIVLVWTEK